jgi:hypothetical protein
MLDLIVSARKGMILVKEIGRDYWVSRAQHRSLGFVFTLLLLCFLLASPAIAQDVDLQLYSGVPDSEAQPPGALEPTDTPFDSIIASDGRLNLFTISQIGEVIFTTLEASGSWSEWQSLGGDFVGSPGVTLNDAGWMEVFARDRMGKVHHAWQTDAATWSEWESLGGAIGGDPFVALSSVGRIEVLARSWDGMLHRIHQLQEGGWSRWHSLGGPMEGIPTAATNPNGDLELFVRWTDGRLAHRWQVGGGDWSDWEFIDASLTGNPVAVTLATGRLGVFAPAANGQVVYRLQSPDGSWSDWLLLVQVGAESIEAVRTRVFIDVFISQSMQPVLWTRVTAEGQWIAWEPLGTRPLTLIDAATKAGGDPIVFAIDNATSELLWSVQSSEGLWSAWRPMPDPNQASPIDLHAAPL